MRGLNHFQQVMVLSYISIIFLLFPSTLFHYANNYLYTILHFQQNVNLKYSCKRALPFLLLISAIAFSKSGPCTCPVTATRIGINNFFPLCPVAFLNSFNRLFNFFSSKCSPLHQVSLKECCITSGTCSSEIPPLLLLHIRFLL